MRRVSAVVLTPRQVLTRVGKDAHAKRDVAYLVQDRQREVAILAQSLPLLVRYINEHVSCEAWDRVSVAGMHENLGRTDGRHGGWHKGRYRVRRVPLAQSGAAFEAERRECARSVLVGGRPGGYQMEAAS